MSMKRREYTEEEKDSLAKKMFGEDYGDSGPIWDMKLLDMNMNWMDEDDEHVALSKP